jgi:hypothetical protein
MRGGSPADLGDRVGKGVDSPGVELVAVVAGNVLWHLWPRNYKTREAQPVTSRRAVLRPLRLRFVARIAVMPVPPWTGSWTGIPVESAAMTATADWACAVRAAGGSVACGQASHNPSCVGSSPTRPTCVYM